MKQQLVFIDDARATLFYLAFDLMLISAPIRGGVAYVPEGSVVKPQRDDPAADARNGAVRAALLAESLKDDGPAWAPTIEEARDRAAQLAADAGMPSPPEAQGRFAIVALGGPTRIPVD